MQKVVFFGTFDTTTTPRIQVLIEGLRAHSYEVDVCNVPLRISTALRVKILQQPWRLPILLAHLLVCWARLVYRRARFVRAADYVIVGHLGQFDIHLARLLFWHTPILLDYMISGSDTALDRRVKSSWKQRLLRTLDNSALRIATHVIVDTDEHLRALPNAFRGKGVVVPVGAPNAWFHANNRPVNHPLRVLFFGAFTPLQGTTVIAEALTRTREPLEVTMAGTGQDYAAARALAKKTKASVTWQDWIDAASLPLVTADHDVCLGIFGNTPKALRVTPNKVYQGAAAGCAIVTSDTAPQRRALGDAATYVPVNDAAALAHALDELARNGTLLKKMRQNIRNHADVSFRPEIVVKPLIDMLEL